MNPVAVYRRTIHASVERIWENVLDWEHLPWLHRTSFLDVELIERHRDGFRVWLTQAPHDKPRRSLVETELHRAELHYWTRTLEGSGAGSQIRTSLAPRHATATDITVEFFVPDLPPERHDRAAALYTALYAQLWDEDEEMMQRRQAFLDRRVEGGAERIRLGDVATLRARLPMVLGEGVRKVRLLEIGGDIVVHSTTCPHLGGPLEEAPACEGVVECPWHGYRFDARSGESADGRRLRLAPAPRLEIDADGAASLVFA